MDKRFLKLFSVVTILAVLFGAAPMQPAQTATGDPVLINEVLASHIGTDNAEFVELYGSPGFSLAGLSLIVVESDVVGLGTIDRRIDFNASHVIGSNGFYLVGNPAGLGLVYSVTPNVPIGNDYFENSSLTVALVRTNSLTAGMVTGSEVVLDAVGLTDGGVGDTIFFGAPVIGPDGTFFPAGARRVADGVDTDTAADWVIADFNLGAANTPTAGDAPPPPPETCGDPATLIHTIQGSGLTSPLSGAEGVTVEGIVVGDFQGSGELSGFFLQEEDSDADADPATSEGIFVFNTSFPVSVGDVVRVRGNVVEFETPANSGLYLTELTSVSMVMVCSTGSTVLPTEVYLPAPDPAYLERYEGMLVRLPQTLVISEYFNYERYGEMVLALPLDGETRAFTPTAIDEPGLPALVRAMQNSLHRITLDDGRSSQNPSVVRHPNGDPFTLDNRFRGGDSVTGTTGVMDFSFGLYRIQPTAPALYEAANPRPAAPETVGGNVLVAALNTLNFFLTPDMIQESSNAPDNPDDNLCGPIPSLECRGWDSNQPLEFNRQRDKLLAALEGLDADVIGLNELENTIYVDPLGDPTRGLVTGLNERLGEGAYSYIDTGVIGTDAIRVGMIYKPSVVAPVGDFKLLTSAVDPRFIDTLSRPVLAQTFEVVSTGARFTVAVNHLKSKGSECPGDPDTGDGQGNCNLTRTAAAQALVDWLASDPTGSGDPDFLIIGDLNSYAMEDPITAIKAGPDDMPGTLDDYTNLIEKYQGPYAYSYVFDGQAGYLDHALANPTLSMQVTGVAHWHINADEPDILDYDTSFKPPAQDALYEPNAYRSSDHDPVIVGLNLLYDFTGFFEPLYNFPFFNVTNAGSAVPVKFSLDGDYGLDVFAPGYPVSVRIACPGSTGPAPAPGTAPTFSPAGLTYDPETGYYTYVWKTEKAWANTCRQFVVQLNDGSLHRLNFQFTK